MNLNELVEGEKAIITECNHRRLLEYGFIPKTPIEIYKKVNGSTAISIRGTIIACRDNLLSNVYITKTRN